MLTVFPKAVEYTDCTSTEGVYPPHQTLPPPNWTTYWVCHQSNRLVGWGFFPGHLGKIKNTSFSSPGKFTFSRFSRMCGNPDMVTSMGYPSRLVGWLVGWLVWVLRHVNPLGYFMPNFFILFMNSIFLWTHVLLYLSHRWDPNRFRAIGSGKMKWVRLIVWALWHIKHYGLINAKSSSHLHFLIWTHFFFFNKLTFL